MSLIQKGLLLFRDVSKYVAISLNILIDVDLDSGMFSDWVDSCTEHFHF